MDGTRGDKRLKVIQETVSAIKVYFYCVVIYAVLRILSAIALKFEISYLEIAAICFTLPLRITTLVDSAGWNYIFGFGFAFAFFILFLVFDWTSDSVDSFYISSFIRTYLVAIPAAFFWKVVTISVAKLGEGFNLYLILNLPISIICILALLFLLFVSINSVYEASFVPTSEMYGERLEKDRQKLIDKYDEKRELEKKQKLEKTNKDKVQNKNFNYKDNQGVSNGFSENKELAKKIRRHMESVPTNKRLSFDTNILIKTPLLVKELSNHYAILLSKQVFDELDRKKTDNRIGANARMAMRMIEAIQVEGKHFSISSVEDRVLREYGLRNDRPDDVIIGCCVEQKLNGEDIVFISEDRGARITARNANLDVLNF